MEIKVNVINEMRKLRDTAYSDRYAWIEELIQNSQRAKATFVQIDLAEDKVLFKDNGIGCESPEFLFEKSTSGWDESVQSQNPFGEGFFSVLGVSNHITVESIGFKAIFDARKMFEQGDVNCVDICTKNRNKGFLVTLSDMTDKYDWRGALNKIKELSKYIHSIQFGVTTPYHEQGILVEKRGFTDTDGNKFAVQINQMGMTGWISPFKWGKDGYAGDSIQIMAQERNVTKIHMQGITGLIHVSDGLLDLRSPDRKSVIDNDKYQSFKNTIRKIRERIMWNILYEGGDDDLEKYGEIIDNILDVEDYCSHLKFLIHGKDDVIEGPAEIESLEMVMEGDFMEVNPFAEELDMSLFRPHLDMFSSLKIPQATNYFSPRTGVSKPDLEEAFYVDSKDLVDNAERVSLASYYDVPVIVARNILERNALIHWGVPHISTLEEKVEIELEAYNVQPKDDHEIRALYILGLISKMFNLDKDLFKIADTEGRKIIKLGNRGVREEPVEAMAIASEDSIYIDRACADMSMLSIRSRGLTNADRQFLVVNLDTIAHELAHVIYDTVDNTQAHAEAQIKIMNQILKSLY